MDPSRASLFVPPCTSAPFHSTPGQPVPVWRWVSSSDGRAGRGCPRETGNLSWMCSAKVQGTLYVRSSQYAARGRDETQRIAVRPDPGSFVWLAVIGAGRLRLRSCFACMDHRRRIACTQSAIMWARRPSGRPSQRAGGTCSSLLVSRWCVWLLAWRGAAWPVAGGLCTCMHACMSGCLCSAAAVSWWAARTLVGRRSAPCGARARTYSTSEYLTARHRRVSRRVWELLGTGARLCISQRFGASFQSWIHAHFARLELSPARPRARTHTYVLYSPPATCLDRTVQSYVRNSCARDRGAHVHHACTGRITEAWRTSLWSAFHKPAAPWTTAVDGSFNVCCPTYCTCVRRRGVAVHAARLTCVVAHPVISRWSGDCSRKRKLPLGVSVSDAVVSAQ